MADFAAMTSTDSYLSLPNAPLNTADVIILPVQHEQTVTFKPGTAQGPSAILSATDQLEFYEEDRGWCPTQHMLVSVLPPVTARQGEGEEAFHHRLSGVAADLPGRPLLIGLGGEHSITPDLVFGRMPRGGTIVQIDAHADLRASYHGSVYNHACPMYRLRKRGYRLVQVGIRSLDAAEAALIAEDDAISTYLDRALRHRENWQKLLHDLAMLTGPVWLTIDMDGFDPATVAGVGTPQPGGLS